ncbi:MAG: outer-membrane lipoprotein carrier protein LolA [Candidatus Coatesbacteria bacterium]
MSRLAAGILVVLLGALPARSIAGAGVPADAAAPRASVALSTTSTGGVDGVLARVQSVEDRVRDVTLTFRQTTLLKATGDSGSTTGTLALMRSPERFRVTFTAPVEQIALYDGTYLWLYLPAAAQAYRQKAGPQELARVLGLNPAEPVRSFRRGYRASLAGCDGRGCTVDFARGGSSPMTWHVRVSATTWRMDEAWFENDEVKVSLSCYDYRVNRKLTAGDFRLALPRDVEIQDGIPMMFGAKTP